MQALPHLAVSFLLFHPLRGIVAAAWVVAGSLAADATSNGSTLTTIIVSIMTAITGLGTAYITVRLGRNKVEAAAPASPAPAPAAPEWNQPAIDTLVHELVDTRVRLKEAETRLELLSAPPTIPPPPPPAAPRRGARSGRTGR